MITLSHGQMAAIRTRKVGLFGDKVHDALQAKFRLSSHQPLSRDLVGEAISVAFSYGFRSERSAVGFVECAWMFGLGFHKDRQDAKEVLRKDALTPDEKLCRLKALRGECEGRP